MNKKESEVFKELLLKRKKELDKEIGHISK